MRYTKLDQADLKLLYRIVQWGNSDETDPDKFFSLAEKDSLIAEHLCITGYCFRSGKYWWLPTTRGKKLVKVLNKLGEYLNDPAK